MERDMAQHIALALSLSLSLSLPFSFMLLVFELIHARHPSQHIGVFTSGGPRSDTNTNTIQ